jgi:excisionase family DNA binding protein
MEPNTEPLLMVLGDARSSPRRQPVELTVREYAQQERVTERTVRNWISKGAVTVRRTPGGRLRIPASR